MFTRSEECRRMTYEWYFSFVSVITEYLLTEINFDSIVRMSRNWTYFIIIFKINIKLSGQ